jgi:hypothetical protein
METMMRPNRESFSTPALNYEQWREMLRPNWGLYSTDDPKGFAGRVRTRHICGFNASDINNNVRRCERTQRPVLHSRAFGWIACQYAVDTTLLSHGHGFEISPKIAS